MAITIAQICDAIESTLGAAVTVARSESYDELTEGIHDLPMLQVYPEGGNQDAGGNTDRASFQAGSRQTSVMIHVDYYARPRRDLAVVVAVIEGRQQFPERQIAGAAEDDAIEGRDGNDLRRHLAASSPA